MAWWFGMFATAIAVIMTGIGIGSNSGSADAGVTSVLCMGAAVLSLGLIIRSTARWLLEPKVNWTVPWSQVRVLGTDGKFVHLKLTWKGTTWIGRLEPVPKPDSERLMVAIATRRLPDEQRLSSWMRPSWVDRMVLVAVLAGLGYAAVEAYPIATDLLTTLDEPRSGPLAGIPDPIPATRLEGFVKGCVHETGDAPVVTNSLVGSTLTWSATATSGWAVGHLRWEAGTQRLELVQAPSTESAGGLEGFCKRWDYEPSECYMGKKRRNRRD